MYQVRNGSDNPHIFHDRFGRRVEIKAKTVEDIDLDEKTADEVAAWEESGLPWAITGTQETSKQPLTGPGAPVKDARGKTKVSAIRAQSRRIAKDDGDDDGGNGDVHFNESMTREQLDAIAKESFDLDTSNLANKHEVMEAIEAEAKKKKSRRK